MLTNTNIIYKQKRYSIGFGKHRLFEHFNKKLLLYLDKSIPFICPFSPRTMSVASATKSFAKFNFAINEHWTMSRGLLWLERDIYLFLFLIDSASFHYGEVLMGGVTFRFLFKFANFERKCHFHFLFVWFLPQIPLVKWKWAKSIFGQIFNAIFAY